MRPLSSGSPVHHVQVIATQQARRVHNKSVHAGVGLLQHPPSALRGLQPHFLPLGLGLHGADPGLYLWGYLVLIAYSMDSDVHMLSYMAAYCYDVYFSIIVLKVGLKLIEILRNKIKYQTYRKGMIMSFVTYQVLLLGALVYESLSTK